MHPFTATRRAWIASACMLAAAAGAYAMTPRTRRSDRIGPLDLEAVIPVAFGDWQIDRGAGAVVIDPQTQATIAATYTATLSRVYLSRTGERVMLSLAYGAELSDTGIGLHYPEVCYPAQGFKVDAAHPVTLQLMGGTLRAKRLETHLGNSRQEPVTYWTMIGDRAEYGGLDRKLAEVRSGLRGERADGLLFRISSITRDSQAGFKLHERFADALLSALSPEARARVAGI